MDEDEEFAFAMAFVFQRPDIESLQMEMGLKLWQRWRNYYLLHPFGPKWDWHQAAMAPWAAYNFRPFRGKDAKFEPVSKFIPYGGVEEPKVELEPTQKLEALAAVTGAVVTIGRKRSIEDE